MWGDPKTYYFFLHVGAAPNSDYAATIPLSVYAMFQLMFAIITVALITGSFAGGLGGWGWVGAGALITGSFAGGLGGRP